MTTTTTVATTTANAILEAPTPRPRITTVGGSADYRTDLQKLIDALKKTGVSAGHLGEVLDSMGRQGQLMSTFQDECFDIRQKRHLAPETIEYLNYLEKDKLFQCRLCYTHADWLWCDFHRNHAYRSPDCNLDSVHYVKHLNSDMGVVMLIEEYFFHLSSFNNKHEAKRALKRLTDFETLSCLMASFNHVNGDELDTNAYELMDFE
uniref:DekiORF117 n=1 Tax=Dendrolimus kikuchii nucleopolyhedrovirus TaxID=1219875 RepID=V9LST5_9ABAC|nr:DekiORF117 [Dendrolimus kikuchii nucleopolyhedrovirus]